MIYFFTSFVLAGNKKKKNIPNSVRFTDSSSREVRRKLEISQKCFYNQNQCKTSGSSGKRLTIDFDAFCLKFDKSSLEVHSSAKIQNRQSERRIFKSRMPVTQIFMKMCCERGFASVKNKLGDIIYVRLLCNEENRCQAKIMISKYESSSWVQKNVWICTYFMQMLWERTH